MPTLNYNQNFKSAKKFLKGNIVNYQIKDLFDEESNSGERGYIVDLNPKFSNGENLQRDLVWSLKQKQELILSVLKNQKLPVFHISIYNNRNEEENPLNQRLFKVIDGKQRLSTLKDFLENKFSIEINGVEYFYTDFDSEATYQFNSYSLDVNVFYEYKYVDTPQHNVILTDQELYEWFYLVNFAGTPQDEKHLEHLKKQI